MASPTRKEELKALVEPFVRSRRSPQTAAAYEGTVRRFLRRCPNEGITVTAAALDALAGRPGVRVVKRRQGQAGDPAGVYELRSFTSRRLLYDIAYELLRAHQGRPVQKPDYACRRDRRQITRG